MALKQRHGAAEIATNDTKMGRTGDSDREKHKDNSEILTATLLPPQYMRRQIFTFRLETCATPLRGPQSKRV